MKTIKNILIRAFVWLWQKWIPQNTGDHQKILIVSTTGLGDTVWATPAIRAIKVTYPDAQLHVLTTGLGKEVLLYDPHIDDIHVISSQSRWSLWKLLKKSSFDTILIFHASQRFVFPLCALLGAKRIISTEGENKGLDALCTYLTPKRPVHEIERRRYLAEAIGASCQETPIEIPTSQEEMEEALHFLHHAGWKHPNPLIVLQPGAKDAFKIWPKEYFIQTALALQEHHPLILVTGSPNEAKYVQAIAREIPHSIPLFGQISLRVLICILQKASLLITNDTGTMHLGFSQSTPTLALFSPTDPRFCGPRLIDHATIIYKPPSCHTCLKKRCREAFCMRQINVKEVIAKAHQILEGRL